MKIFSCKVTFKGKPKAQAGNVTIIRRGEGKAFQAEGSVERIQSAGNSK
jgi:hypothetical protein